MKNKSLYYYALYNDPLSEYPCRGEADIRDISISKRERCTLYNHAHEAESLSHIDKYSGYPENLRFYSTKRDNLNDLSNNKLFTFTPWGTVMPSYIAKTSKDITKIINSPMITKFENVLIDYCIHKVKTTFSVKLSLTFDTDTYKKFLCWLKKRDKLFSKHIIRTPHKPYYILKDADIFVKAGEYTFARILTGESIKRDTKEESNVDISAMRVNMYIFGKHARKISYEIENLTRGNDKLIYFTVTGSSKNDEYDYGVNIYRDISIGRSKDSVFLNDDIKETILNHVNKFFANKNIYKKRNLTYKTGILLYGEPGTGKSTIANMIATEYHCDMVIIKMNQFANINIDLVTSAINADDKTYIVVLEDIDCVIGDRQSEKDDLENKKNVNKLLQFLDSTSSPSNVIFVATTNHIENLDEAILRDGRFDLKVNITNINKTAAVQMCKSFGIKNEETIKRLFNDNNTNGRINPAKLQNLILKEIE